MSLTTFAKVNDFGFIETPYRVVTDNKITDDVRYYDASLEADQVIAQANAPMTENKTFANSMVTARCAGDVSMVPVKR